MLFVGQPESQFQSSTLVCRHRYRRLTRTMGFQARRIRRLRRAWKPIVRILKHPRKCTRHNCPFATDFASRQKWHVDHIGIQHTHRQRESFTFVVERFQFSFDGAQPPDVAQHLS